MRKTIVFILLLIYTGSQLLPVLIYYHESVIHTISIFRQQIRSIRSREGSTLSITISNDQYLLAKQRKNEIILDGSRYDIKRIRISGDKVSMELLKDEKEDYLLNVFKRMSAVSKDNHQQKKNIRPGKWFFKIHLIINRISILPSGALPLFRPPYKTHPDLLPVSLNPQEHPPEIG